MKFHEEERLFNDFVKGKGLKHSEKRITILMVFLKTERHLTADELFHLVKKKDRSIGVATVYRTLKLICKSGLGRELRLESESVRYEHNYKHDHHDHIICVQCDKLIEIMDDELEKIQGKLARRAGFVLQGHRLLMYGLCRECTN